MLERLNPAQYKAQYLDKLTYPTFENGSISGRIFPELYRIALLPDALFKV